MASSPDFKPAKDVVIPEAIISDIESETGKDRNEMTFPMALGRGVPTETNEDLILLASLYALRERARVPKVLSTYTGEKHSKAKLDKNAFRGDKKYLEDVAERLEIEFGLDYNVNQIVTGSAGGQELVTSMLELFFLDEEREAFGSTNLTFNRTKNYAIRHKRKMVGVEHDEEGVDLDSLRDFFEKNPKGVFFLVHEGGNPDGVSNSIDKVDKMADIAKEYGGVILLDASYARLAFSEKGVGERYPLLRRHLTDGTVSIVFSGTKEGKDRGPAFVYGSEERMTKLLAVHSDKGLSPNYAVQRADYMASGLFAENIENARELFQNIFGKELDASTYRDYLNRNIRPHLSGGFDIVKEKLTAAGIRLSTEKVEHGYNVCVFFPEGCDDDQSAQFFTTLSSLGVGSGNLDVFIVDKKVHGFRIPFGGYTHDELKIMSPLIVEAHQRVFG